MDSLLARSAAQGGAFTTAQAREAGYTRHAIAASVRRKRWRSLGKGVFVERPLWEAMTAEARHLCQLHARLLVLDPAWVAARRTAAVAHGLPLLGKVPGEPQLLRHFTRDVGAASTRHERVAPLPETHVVRVPGPRRTSLARTVVDLAREESFRSAVVVADAALRRGLQLSSLDEVVTRCSAWPGLTSARHVLGFADGLAESVLESISRVAYPICAIPMPELQVEVLVDDRLVARVDNLWRDANLVGEADGEGKYGSTRNLYAEKRRQDELEELGLEVVRWGWDEAWRPRGQLDVKVFKGMARGRVKAVDPRVRFRPTTVEEALRRGARAA